MLTLPAFGEAPEGLSFNGDAEYVRRGPGSAPAASLPAGFGKKASPLGLQSVYREDHRMLRAAKWIENVFWA
jgi:hypothetical protein